MARSRIKKAKKENKRLDELDNNGLFDMQHDLHNYVGEWGEIWCCRPNCDPKEPVDTFEEPHTMEDHGLHVLDIIRDIAPKNDTQIGVSVHRVLDDYGVGDITTLAAAVLAAVLDGHQEPLVLNMSLGFGSNAELLELVLTYPELTLDRDRWALIMHGSLDELERKYPDLKPQPDDDESKRKWDLIVASGPNPERALAWRTDLSMGAPQYILGGLPRLRENGVNREVLAIAAAGNDACPGKPTPAPRFPAFLESVVGVASVVDAQGKLSDFSNLDDVVGGGPRDDGIGATGEDLIGIHTKSHFPKSNAHNDEGWASWKGTSFATPIVSAIAARLLAGGADVGQVQTWVEDAKNVVLNGQLLKQH